MNLKPIVLDIETSGRNLSKCGILQIGAIDLNTMEEFLEEARIDDGDEIINIPYAPKKVLEVLGKTEEELRDKDKQSQRQMLMNFFELVEQRHLKNFLCQNPQFDIGFLEIKSMKYGLKIPFHYRSFDLHTLAQLRYYDLRREFLIESEKKYSGMGLDKILEFCGIGDHRQTHNALEDCRLTAECFLRLLDGKNLFSEYSQYKIPEDLKK